RIDELARACKRAGDRRPVDHIRADLFLGSLDGSFESLSDSEIVTHVRTHPFLDATPSDDSADTPDLQPADTTTTTTTNPDTDSEPAGTADDTAADTAMEPAAASGDTATNTTAEPTAASGDTAADTATEPAAETAAKPGSARSSGTPSRTRPEARSGTGSTGTAIHGQARDGDLTQDRPGSHTGDHTVHAGDPAGVPVRAPDGRADDTSDGETRDHDESAPADTSNDPPRQEGVDGHADDRTRDIADKAADETAGKTADKAVGKAADRAADEADDKAIAEVVDEAADNGETALADPRAGGGDSDDSAKPSPVSPLPADAWPTQTRPTQTRPVQAWSVQAWSVHAWSVHAWSVHAWSVHAWSVREIRVELTTLLGLDEHPAHLPGWGMVHAAQSRRIVASMLTGQWRFAVCTDNGHLLLAGITGRRPCPPAQQPARDTRRGGIVELQITLTRLRELAATPTATGAWAPLIADLARHAQHAETRQPQNNRPHTHPPDAAQPTPSGKSGKSGESAQSAQSGESTASGSGGSGGSAQSAESGSTESGSGGSGGSAQSAESESESKSGSESKSKSGSESEESAGRRHAGAALRRYVQIRGRVCSWPGCRMPATRTDQDHIHPWADNGATTADNLHLACRHDHRTRHIGGWRVTSAGPQLIVWTSPLGHAYPSPLPKIIQPAPDPQPRNWPDAPPGHLPANPAGTPDTIMTPSRPQTTPSRSGGRHDTTSGEADSETRQGAGHGAGHSARQGAGHGAGRGAGHGASEQADDETGGASFKDDREVPPF
ncbi:HNH endonuclease, partial [Microbispora bryophytorum]|uniref:HNH endonuclease n=1 Tax=Microbispora bryophytorum TaxID=1460882 RepID=UPI0033DCE24C